MRCRRTYQIKHFLLLSDVDTTGLLSCPAEVELAQVTRTTRRGEADDRWPRLLGLGNRT
jgi:hypothetical protein